MLKAIGKNLVIRPEELAEKSASGLLFLPESAKKIRQTGIVLSVGPKVELGISVGDRIAYEPNGGRMIQINGETVLLIDRSEVLAKEEEIEE